MFPTRTYRKIVVPLDGSAFAEQALPVAADIARRAGATLELVRAHEPEVFADLGPRAPADVEACRRAGEEAYLADAERRAKLAADVSVTRRLLDGWDADAIAGHARSVEADLIVMTTHARGPLGRLVLGGVAERTVRMADVPVLLIRPAANPDPSADRAAPGGESGSHILIPLDGEPLAEEAIEAAVALGRLTDARYTLVEVISGVPTLLEAVNGTGPVDGLGRPGHLPAGVLGEQLREVEAELRKAAAAYLESVAVGLRGEGADVRTRVVLSEQPATAIADVAREDGADVIALATHARHGVARLFLGSVAGAVLRTSRVPVLMCRPGCRSAVHGPPTVAGTP